LSYSVVVSRDFEKFPVPALNVVATGVGDDPCSAVYMSKTEAKIIICPVGSIERGFHAEQEPRAVLPYGGPTEVLGKTVWESLLQFKRTPNLNLRATKKTDWPAYRASGAKNVRAFEEEYLRISLTAFPSVLRVEAAVPTPDADGLFVGRLITIACQFEALGELLHVVFRCGQHLAQQRPWASDFR
jgi:hypothetical protein